LLFFVKHVVGKSLLKTLTTLFNMENQSTSINNPDASGNELSISRKSAAYLSETEKWTKFLSIVGFAFVGIIVIIALFASSIFSSVPFGQNSGMGGSMGFVFSGIYFVMAALYFFPIWYLYKFSTNIKDAIQSKSSEQLELALSNQKSFFKFIGIFTVVVLVFYGIGLLIAVLGIL